MRAQRKRTMFERLHLIRKYRRR